MAEFHENGLVVAGNALVDGEERRGWFVGHFMEPGIRNSEDVEVKLARYDTFTSSGDVAKQTDCATVTILITGRVALKLAERLYVLDEQYDYLAWGEGILHSWEAEAGTDALTVRWPSLPTPNFVELSSGTNGD